MPEGESGQHVCQVLCLKEPESAEQTQGIAVRNTEGVKEGLWIDSVSRPTRKMPVNLQVTRQNMLKLGHARF